MHVDLLIAKLARVGIRAKLRDLNPRSMASRERYQVDFAHDRRGRYLRIAVDPLRPVVIRVLGLDEDAQRAVLAVRPVSDRAQDEYELLCVCSGQAQRAEAPTRNLAIPIRSRPDDVVLN